MSRPAWETIGGVGYLGSKRDATHRAWDELHGPGNWRMRWEVLGSTLDFAGATRLYEDAYFAFLGRQPELLADLCASASDVYDDAESNVRSGLDYTIQETGRTHLQDIALRACVIRHGRTFSGPELVQIRDKLATNRFSLPLSPGQVPFHRPEWIRSPQLAGSWWREDSVEAFYQSNRILQARRF